MKGIKSIIYLIIGFIFVEIVAEPMVKYFENETVGMIASIIAVITFCSILCVIEIIIDEKEQFKRMQERYRQSKEQ